MLAEGGSITVHVIVQFKGEESLEEVETVTEKVLFTSLVSLTAKINPVASLASPAVGDQSTVTLAGSPPLPEVITDFVINPIMQNLFAG